MLVAAALTIVLAHPPPSRRIPHLAPGGVGDGALLAGQHVPHASAIAPPSLPVPTPPHTTYLAVSGTAPSLPVRMFFTVLALPFSMLMAPINMLLEMLSR